MHFTPDRSALSSPSTIATRTRRLLIGMAVHTLPLNSKSHAGVQVNSPAQPN